MHPDEELAKAAKQGDTQAFAELYERHINRMYRYVVTRVGNTTVAEDVTGDIFIRAFESIGSYEWRGVPFSSWLFKIAHNRIVDHFRREGSREFVYVDGPLSLDGPDPHDVVEFKMDTEEALTALRELTESQRQVIALRFASGLSLAETAAVMKKKEGAIKALQHSAIQAMRRILERRGKLSKVVRMQDAG